MQQLFRPAGPALTDGELVAAARGGDGAALGLLLERHRPRLLATAIRLLGVRIDVERVITNDGIAVVESRFVNPPEAPDHCPPGVAVVMVGNDDRTWAMRLHLAPRAPRVDED